MARKKTSFGILLGLLWVFVQARPAIAQSDNTALRVLLPVAIENVPGARGSLWTSELWIHNGTPDTVMVGPTRLASEYRIPAGQTDEPPIFLRSDGSHPGLFLFVESEDHMDVTFNLRIQDLSRQAETWGTEIPVVRDTEFHGGKLVLLNVPLDERFRQTLRIYESDLMEDSAVLVSVYRMGFAGDDLLLDERRVDLRLAIPDRSPAYAQIDSFSGFSGLAGTERVRVEIMPMTEDMRLWAFVSVTNNETQHVTTITPQ